MYKEMVDLLTDEMVKVGERIERLGNNSIVHQDVLVAAQSILNDLGVQNDDILKRLRKIEEHPIFSQANSPD